MGLFDFGAEAVSSCEQQNETVFLKMTVSTTLESFLRSRQLACRGSSGGTPPQYLARLEEALQEWRETTGCSVTAIAKELRAMGLNLATGRAYGSPHNGPQSGGSNP